MHVGVISDTHGLLRPEAVSALRGSELILHAGDVGDPAILDELKKIAPVHAIRGNIDVEAWARKLPATLTVEAAGKKFFLIHNVRELKRTPPDIDCVISGHSHQPLSDVRDGVLFFNPGSAGPRRFSLPITVGGLHIEAGQVCPEIVKLL